MWTAGTNPCEKHEKLSTPQALPFKIPFPGAHSCEQVFLRVWSSAADGIFRLLSTTNTASGTASPRELGADEATTKRIREFISSFQMFFRTLRHAKVLSDSLEGQSDRTGEDYKRCMTILVMSSCRTTRHS
jgi:hypothetical protein